MACEKYRHFTHVECEYFPCHGGVPVGEFNCLFCFCPLYLLADDCGGNFTYTKSGIKDCSACILPHAAGAYEYIEKKLEQVIKKAKKQGLEETYEKQKGIKE